MGGWRERLEPGALNGAKLDDLVATVDHVGVPIGRYPGTLEIEHRDDGLHWSVDPPESRADVREAVERGDLRAGSWRMVVAPGGDEWRGNVRHVHRIVELRDVAIVTNPAYPAASVELRERPDTTTQKEPAISEPITEAAEATDDTSTTTSTTGESGSTASTGTLRVESRSETGEQVTEERVMRELGEALREVEKGESRALSGSISLAPTAVGVTLFDKLRAAAVLLRSGIRVLDMPNADSVTYPSITGDVAPAFYAEGATITPGDPTFSSITATPRKLAHLVQVSNEVLDDSTPPLQQVLNDHLLGVLAVKLDAMLLEGDGTPPNVRGLKNVASIQTLAAAANGQQPTFDNISDAIALLEAVNVAPENIRVVLHTRNVSTLRKAKASTAGTYLWGDPSDPTTRPVFGKSWFATSQLSTNEVQGTSGAVCNSAYVYDASQVIWVRRQDPQIVLDRSRLFNSDQSELRATMRGDLIVPNPTAIVRLTGLLA